MLSDVPFFYITPGGICQRYRFLENDKWKVFTNLVWRRRGPEIAQYTNGQDEVIEQRTWFLLPLLTPPRDNTLMRQTQFADAQNQFHRGGVVGEYCSDMCCFDYPASRSVWFCVLGKPVIFAVWRILGLCINRYVDYVVFLARSDLSSESTGYMGFIFWLDFVRERIRGFGVRSSLLFDNFAAGWLLLHVYVLIDF